MTLHYHGTPITPRATLIKLAGRHFCVSFAQPQDVETVHRIGQSVMLDNGAYSAWKAGYKPNWPAYYKFCERWLAYPTTWAVIPDVVDGPVAQQTRLLNQWPFAHRGAPVWHMNEPTHRLLHLVDAWPRVCIGSTSQFKVVGSAAWHRRMQEVFNQVAKRHRHFPWLHMLRGMKLCGTGYPFGSVDSTDIARNHSAKHNDARRMVDRWDVVQCAGHWTHQPLQKSFW